MNTVTMINNLRARVRSASDLVSDAELLRVLNQARLVVDKYVLDNCPMWYSMRFTQDLEEDVREYRTSYLMRDIFKIQANLLGSDGGANNWVTLVEATLGVEYQFADDETVIQSKFTNQYRGAKFHRDGVFVTILSGKIYDATGGLKIVGTGRPKDLSDASDTRDLADYLPAPDYTPGVPLDFHVPWLTLASRILKLEADKSATLDAEEQAVYDLLLAAAKGLQPRQPILADNTQLNLSRLENDNGFNF